MLFLNFYGLKVKVISEPALAEALSQDFFYFLEKGSFTEREVNLSFSAHQKKYEGTHSSLPVFKGAGYTAYGLGGQRICDYGDGAVSVDSNQRNKRGLRLFAPTFERLYEITYLALLSVVGEELDCNGFHRVHGLAFERANRRFLILLPQGGGKSAICSLMRERGEARFYSDESPLLKAGSVYPFPIRVAIAESVARALKIPSHGPAKTFKRKHYPPKLLIPFSAYEVAEAGPLDYLVIGEKVEANPSIEAGGTPSALKALGESLIVGLGLAQMAEHMVRFSSPLRLPKIAVSRTLETLVLSSGALIFKFKVEPDARRNELVLNAFINDQLRSREST